MAKPKVILERAIEKAVKEGYPDPYLNHTIGFYLDGKNFYSIIFDREFAECLWSGQTEEVVSERLQEMVLSEDPLKYLEKTIK